jgi:hypothetical protein
VSALVGRQRQVPEHVVEGAVLHHQHHDVVDGRQPLGGIVVGHWDRAGRGRRNVSGDDVDDLAKARRQQMGRSAEGFTFEVLGKVLTLAHPPPWSTSGSARERALLIRREPSPEKTILMPAHSIRLGLLLKEPSAYSPPLVEVGMLTGENGALLGSWSEAEMEWAAIRGGASPGTVASPRFCVQPRPIVGK